MSKSTELQWRLRNTSLDHISNRRKDAKCVYLVMLCYDIEMYTKQAEDLVNPVQRQKQAKDINHYVQAARSTRDAPKRARMPMHVRHSK